jgi:SSS family solute:Na+ symporter
MNTLQPADYFVFCLYFLIIFIYGYRVYHRRRSSAMSTREFFLAEGSLTWWAIGASLIASNISAEHFIGMSGSGFAIGLAISTYEWMAAATLIVVAVFLFRYTSEIRSSPCRNFLRSVITDKSVPSWLYSGCWFMCS